MSTEQYKLDCISLVAQLSADASALAELRAAIFSQNIFSGELRYKGLLTDNIRDFLLERFPDVDASEISRFAEIATGHAHRRDAFRLSEMKKIIPDVMFALQNAPPLLKLQEQYAVERKFQKRVKQIEKRIDMGAIDNKEAIEELNVHNMLKRAYTLTNPILLRDAERKLAKLDQQESAQISENLLAADKVNTSGLRTLYEKEE